MDIRIMDINLNNNILHFKNAIRHLNNIIKLLNRLNTPIHKMFSAIRIKSSLTSTNNLLKKCKDVMEDKQKGLRHHSRAILAEMMMNIYTQIFIKYLHRISIKELVRSVSKLLYRTILDQPILSHQGAQFVIKQITNLKFLLLLLLHLQLNQNQKFQRQLHQLLQLQL